MRYGHAIPRRHIQVLVDVPDIDVHDNVAALDQRCIGRLVIEVIEHLAISAPVSTKFQQDVLAFPSGLRFRSRNLRVRIGRFRIQVRVWMKGYLGRGAGRGTKYKANGSRKDTGKPTDDAALNVSLNVHTVSDALATLSVTWGYGEPVRACKATRRTTHRHRRPSRSMGV